MSKLKLGYFHYAWIILALSFLALLSAQGVRLSFGAFIEPWEDEFSTSRGTISLVALISYIVYGVSQPFIGRLVDQYGVRVIFSFSVLLIGLSTIATFFATSPWQLMIIYGVIASIGFGGASNVAGSVAISNWFVEKKGFAIGLMTAGSAGGQLVLVPLSLFLITVFGWKLTVLILGLFLTLIVFPLLYIFLRTHPSEKKVSPLGGEVSIIENPAKPKLSSAKKVTIFMLLRRKEFLFLLLPFFVCGVTTSGLIDTHLIPFAQYCGITPVVAGVAVSLLAGFNIFGTIFSGYLSDRFNCKNMLAFLYGSRALTVVILLVMIYNTSAFGFILNESYLLLIFAISFGMVDFATVAPTIKLATEYFRELSVGVILGWLYLSHQLGSALGAYLPGLLFDLSGSYTDAFVYSIILLVAAACLSYMLPSIHKLPQIKNENHSIT
ncbi:MFS family permease [Bacillus mesophilus]|uniref:MFS transporter n=1 Tax=Bacillus mesophilus TaxID=1808955 RepID=A0A6M0Q7N3_9BACI|nr:MFS transporter [Bacillus mesophilus]MBM7660978.1 MFS family permease [Bacillus mesophilus]NEY71480.1 MFS transporter [Bacillus mesophilus]